MSLAKTAHVVGDILHEALAIEQGAFLEGHCRRLNEGTHGKKETEGGIALLKSGKAKISDVAVPKRTDGLEMPAAE